ncbi:hypothetical protein A2706_02435 [Candidatus Peribacteria bacterium RIFCSPHIGHO2_01_FULL_51_35]|nr:MAG: hypothetical protein A2706_02435 [Candidatus Peribacteria bacterium RIFCSPHIGHO2_01_FULL_51_35]
MTPNFSTPSTDYRMPAEWEPHAATWLTWPHDEAHWPGLFEKIPPIWARITKELIAGEDVHILIHDTKTEKIAEKELKDAGATGDRIHLHRVLNNFSWARDHGPIFVKNANGDVRITHWMYNAWGEKWMYDMDEHIPSIVSKLIDMPETRIPMVLEGGSIDVNGKGSLLTTTSCLLHKNRNPQLKKNQIEQHLKEHLGVTNVLWLGDGIVGDDTNGHIDDMTRFIGEKEIFTVIEENKDDENHAPLKANLDLLKEMTDQDGNPFMIHAVPMPAPLFHEGIRLPASYSNFYIGNAVVLLPVFNDLHDSEAINVLKKAFPTRKIVPIDARDLVWGFGAFHCVTQQQPT